MLRRGRHCNTAGWFPWSASWCVSKTASVSMKWADAHAKPNSCWTHPAPCFLARISTHHPLLCAMCNDALSCHAVPLSAYTLPLTEVVSWVFCTPWGWWRLCWSSLSFLSSWWTDDDVLLAPQGRAFSGCRVCWYALDQWWWAEYSTVAMKLESSSACRV